MAPREPICFIVEGRWPFPFDMLRYDCCYPLRESRDSAALDRVYDTFVATRNEVEPKTRVMLRKDSAFRSDPQISRWRSFRWEVLFAGTQWECEEWERKHPA